MTLLWILLGFLITWLLLIAVGVAVFARHVDRRNRVHPEVPSPAPTWWLVSPGHPATMHRRLRDAVTRVDVAALRRPPSGPAEDLGDELRLQAAELDRHVVHATSLRRPQRRAALRAIDQQIVQLDVLSRRLVALTLAEDPAHRLTNPTPQEALADIGQRLDMIEEAQAEIAAIERSSGLLSVDEAEARLAPSGPGPVPPTPGAAPDRRPTAPTTPAAPASHQPPPPAPGTRAAALPPPSTHDRLPPTPRPAGAAVPRRSTSPGRDPRRQGPPPG